MRGEVMIYQAGITLCWLALVLGFVARRRTEKPREVARARNWKAGVLLQALSIALIGTVRRHGDPGAALGIPALVLAAGSAAFMIAAQRTLGRQWAYEPRLIEGHQLITSGPYAVVRNPIYAGLYGLGLATALVLSSWPVIPLYTGVFAWGTLLRVRCEETLLRESFGAAFDTYAHRVSALVPGVRYGARANVK